ncbi:GDCCVxC domain-containing (seleno)protein [Psychromonas sp. MB-3u-54]|uniref:GDCCVxC domain-containing (seleno)protein n=1 Tax=Psychromonas sp. MB-3u-54 TaxID=2058319 RepID=UPI0022B7E961|nr:GDCCVxC domain-containing (seleno)protein [Psychromonas sp. MB-3u-54]
MPVNACQWFYKCNGCGVLLKAKKGDCCVFCSYGAISCPPIIPCPPIQQGSSACCSS